MNNKEFWYDVMRSGAIIGIIMAISYVFERYVLFYSDLQLGTASVILCGEMLVACVVFVWLLVRFSRRRAAACDPRIGYSYGVALSYILVVSMFAGVIVGVCGTLLTSIVGYDNYVVGVVERLDEVRLLYSNMGINSSELKVFDEVVHAVRTSTQPSMLSNVFAAFNNYILFGGLPGLIIAGIVSRKPEVQNMEF